MDGCVGGCGWKRYGWGDVGGVIWVGDVVHGAGVVVKELFGWHTARKDNSGHRTHTANTHMQQIHTYNNITHATNTHMQQHTHTTNTHTRINTNMYTQKLLNDTPPPTCPPPSEKRVSLSPTIWHCLANHALCALASGSGRVMGGVAKAVMWEVMCCRASGGLRR